ncbi:MAG: dephospho-CoA kinase [Deltaproteobacteria bacterium]|nr:dephospho-CoA kinase [Deltaproteobacteria bacterium]
MSFPVNVVGLTGGIASGKSLVAGFLREAGAPVLDADQLGHMVLEPDGEAYAGTVLAFGREILGDDGTIDRRKLGALVFGNKERLELLASLTHPAISRLAQKGLALVAERGASFAFYEAALLVETGTYRNLSALVVISCPVATQLKRLAARDGLSPEEAAARIASQHALAEKLAVADWVIENDGPPEEARERTLEILTRIEERFGGKV